MKKRYSYNTITFVIFALLITGAFTFFSFAEDTNLTLFEDFDRDGISNSEEETLGTNPKEPDTDGDGYSDGVEIESGYNPLIPAPGDRIVKEQESITFAATNSHTTNITRKISENVVSYLADIQESGQADITSEEFSQVISETVDEEVAFVETPPVDISEFTIKDQEYPELSSKEREERLKEDATEYFTTISYIFISNFPQGFFEKPTDVFQIDITQKVNSFSHSLNDYEYFEDLAERMMSAEEQMLDIAVPEELLDIHAEGIYLLRYTGDIYKSETYKNINSDVAPMIAALAQMQGILDLSVDFQEKVTKKLQEYEIGDLFLDL